VCNPSLGSSHFSLTAKEFKVKVVVCIPARYESSRFPGKVLARDTGKYLVQHTYEQACRAKHPAEVIIAADDTRVQQAAKEFGARCVLTSADHQSGTDRIAEAVTDIEADIVVNLQGDEPEIDPSHIDQVAEILIEGQQAEGRRQKASMATLGAPLASPEQIANPNIVKVITDLAGRAIYFSRSVIPYDRDAQGIGAPGQHLRHIGMYAYCRDFLLKITTLPQSPLEKLEKLEQLRVLENGYSILVGRIEHACDGIDTPEQYAEFVKRDQTRTDTAH
jgi:3-deoxy-manno-octulosonate cytidylyltransferase (CMP-KDO synthetase)